MSQALRLSPFDASKAVAKLHPDWRVDNNRLKRVFVTQDFDSAFSLVSAVSALAQKHDHHPDINFGWGRVELFLTTHSAGGLSEQDFQMAALIDKL